MFSGPAYDNVPVSVSGGGDRESAIVFTDSRHSLQDFACAVRNGLRSDPPSLDCRYLYDETGSRLFDEISRTPEYYLTRTEDEILDRCADEIRDLTGPVSLIELGSGTSEKTHRLLTAYGRTGAGVVYVPVDVSAWALEAARSAIKRRHPSVEVSAIAGTYREAFPRVRSFSPAMVLFLGSTIGNFDRETYAGFWSRVQESLPSGDHFLLGIDLIKDKPMLDAAYNDAAGITDRFIKNIFTRINRELGASVDVGALRHVAEYVSERARVEIFLEFLEDQAVDIEPLSERILVPAGTRVLIEISRKFDAAEVAEGLAHYGLSTARTFTDDRELFGVLLLRKD